jgi:hypothetical protein
VLGTICGAFALAVIHAEMVSAWVRGSSWPRTPTTASRTRFCTAWCAAIAQRLFITEKTVSKHAAGIFAKLDLAPSDDHNRRVLAALAYLGS